MPPATQVPGAPATTSHEPAARVSGDGADPPSRPSRALPKSWPLLLLALGLASTVARFSSQGFFFTVDFFNFRAAQIHHFSLGYLGLPYDIHLSPGHRVLDWGLQQFFPLDFGVAQAVLLLFFVASVVLIFRIGTELAGPGPVPWLLTAVYGTSTVHLTEALWWTSGAQVFPATALSLLCIWTYLRFWRTGAPMLLGASVGALVLALLFYSKALLIPGYLVLLRVLLLEPELPLRQVVRQFRHEWRTWVAYVVPCALYGAFYLGVYLPRHSKGSQRPSLAFLQDFLRIAWADTFVPSLVGIYRPMGTIPTSTHVMLWVAEGALVAMLVGLLVRAPRAWRAVAFFAIGFLVNSLIVAMSRTAFGPNVAYAQRYQAEATYLLVIGACAAVPIVRVRRNRPAGRRQRGARNGSLATAVATVLLLAHVGLAWSADGHILRDSPGVQVDAYLANVKQGVSQIERSPTPSSIVDGIVPAVVIAPWMVYGAYPYNRYSEVFRLFDTSLVFNRPDRALFTVTADGRFRPASLLPGAGGDARDALASGALTVDHGTPDLGAKGFCVTASPVFPIFIELTAPRPLPAGPWYLDLRYRSLADTTLRMHIDAGAGYPYPGSSSLSLPKAGDGASLTDLGNQPVSRIRLDVPRSSTLCVDQMAVSRLAAR